MLTSNAAFALRPSRACMLAPLVTTPGGGGAVAEHCSGRVAAVAGVQAGAVGADPAFFARGSNDLSARAHAEGEHAASVLKVGDEAVRGGAERRVARRGAIEGTVYIRLQVLDAHAHGEGLALECDAKAGEHFENIASGMGRKRGRRALRQWFPAHRVRRG